MTTCAPLCLATLDSLAHDLTSYVLDALDAPGDAALKTAEDAILDTAGRVAWMVLMRQHERGLITSDDLRAGGVTDPGETGGLPSFTLDQANDLKRVIARALPHVYVLIQINEAGDGFYLTIHPRRRTACLTPTN